MNLKNKLVSSAILSSLVINSLPVSQITAQTVVKPTTDKDTQQNTQVNTRQSKVDTTNQLVKPSSQNITQKQTTQQPVVEKPVTQKPVVNKPVVDKTTVQKPVTQKPVVNKPVVDKSTVQKPVTQKPVVNKPVVNKPVVNKPVAEKPAVQKPAVQKPVVKKPVTQKTEKKQSETILKVSPATVQEKVQPKVQSKVQTQPKAKTQSKPKSNVDLKKYAQTKVVVPKTDSSLKTSKTITNSNLVSTKKTIAMEHEHSQESLKEQTQLVKKYIAKLESLKNSRSQLNAELKKIKKEVKKNEKDIADVRKDIKEKSKILLDLKEKNLSTQQEKEKKLELFKQRIAILQKNKTVDFSVLQGSQTLTDMKVRLEQYENLSKNDKKVLDDLTALVSTMDAQERKIKETMKDLDKESDRYMKVKEDLVNAQLKQNTLLKLLNKERIDVSQVVSEETLEADGLREKIENLSSMESDIDLAIEDFRTNALNQEYVKYLDKMKEKRNKVELSIARSEQKLKLLSVKKELTASDKALIESLKKQISKNKKYLKEDGKVGFVAPATGNVTSLLGSRTLFEGETFHSGVDIANAIGTSVVSTEDGIVTYAGAVTVGYGNVIMIQHNIGGKTYTSLYGHLSAIGVKKGDVVKRGELIGLMGNEGRSTGPHLHFELYDDVKTDWSYNHLINPLKFIPKGQFQGPLNY